MRFLFDLVMNFVFFGLVGLAMLGLAQFAFPQHMGLVVAALAISAIGLGFYFAFGRRNATDSRHGPPR